MILPFILYETTSFVEIKVQPYKKNEAIQIVVVVVDNENDKNDDNGKKTTKKKERK